jgi:hypothetical protein
MEVPYANVSAKAIADCLIDHGLWILFGRL